MNIEERRNLTFRLVSIAMIFLNLGFVSYVLYFIITSPSENQIVSIIACVFAALMMIFQIILIARGGKKESALYKIAFNPNGRINNVPLIAIIIFSILGVGFIVLGTLLNILKHFEPIITSSLVILLVAVYLLTNCIIYFIYCLMFKIRKFKIEDLLK